MEPRVAIDIFEGPLDLLLHLIRRRELDVCDVSVADVTDSYLRHVGLLEHVYARAGADLDDVGDFLVVAATLLEMKSARLLPRPASASTGTPDAPAPDAPGELVRQLLDYQRYKRAADALEERRLRHAVRHPRFPASRPVDRPGDEDDLPPLNVDELHAWDLLAIFDRLMAEVGRRGPVTHDVIDDDTPIDLHAADLADRVRRHGRTSLLEVLHTRRSRGEMIGVFLALLELVRESRVRVRRDGHDVVIEPATSVSPLLQEPS